MYSLSTPVGDDGSSTLIDMIPSDNESIEEDIGQQVDREQMKETVWEMVSELPDNLPLVVHERFVSGKTLKEIGMDIGVSLDRFRQLEAKAMRELRKPKNSRRIKPYFDEYLSAYCYRHVGVEHFQRTGMSSTEYAAFRLAIEVKRTEESMRAAGLDFKHSPPQCFRHTFATRCIENGVPPQVFKTILGHSTLAMTMDLYSHVLPDTKAMEMEKIANLF